MILINCKLGVEDHWQYRFMTFEPCSMLVEHAELRMCASTLAEAIRTEPQVLYNEQVQHRCIVLVYVYYGFARDDIP